MFHALAVGYLSCNNRAAVRTSRSELVRDDTCGIRAVWPRERDREMGLIIFLIVGLIAGYIARAVVPGPDPMGLVGTLVLGVIGSFVGGFLAALVTSSEILEFNATGLIGSIIGAIVALLVYRAVNK